MENTKFIVKKSDGSIWTYRKTAEGLLKVVSVHWRVL
jgi:hypothetical protein